MILVFFYGLKSNTKIQWERVDGVQEDDFDTETWYVMTLSMQKIFMLTSKYFNLNREKKEQN
jgi:hypothetical protein